MLENIRNTFYTDNNRTSILISFIATLILGIPTSILGGSLEAFFILILLPMILVAVYREWRLSVMRLRDWNILNVVLTCWLPLFLLLLIIFG